MAKSSQLAQMPESTMPAPAAPTAAADAEVQRAVSEVQVALTIAKRFPRDVLRAKDAILMACTRVELAENATYSYTKGNQEVTGGSIDYAECLAQLWGNLDYGIKELSQSGGVSEVEAYAWDMETNTRRKMLFQVPHLRMAKGELKKLTDPRDIYELIANQGARRLRKCLEDIIPGDIWAAGLRQCEVTLNSKGGAPTDQIKDLIEAFKEFGITPETLARKLGHKLDAVNNAEVLRLRRIFRSLRDGYTNIEAEFGVPATEAGEGDKPKGPREAAKAAAAKARPSTYAAFADTITGMDDVAQVQSCLNSAKEQLPPDQYDELVNFANGRFPGQFVPFE